jgi:hypothetical protein
VRSWRIAQRCVPLTSHKRTTLESGYASVARGQKPLVQPLQKEKPLPALLLVLLLILIFFVVGFAAVKFLIWVAIILAIIWLIGFFVRGAEGARWYRW